MVIDESWPKKKKKKKEKKIKQTNRATTFLGEVGEVVRYGFMSDMGKN